MSEYVRQELLDAWIVAHDKHKARAEAAEAKVARAHTIATRYTGSTNPALFMARDLTAALADEEDDRHAEQAAHRTRQAVPARGGR